MPRISMLFIMLSALLCGSALAASLDAGKPVPAFSTKTLDGKAISPASSKGRILLINLWATWCEPCRKEMPAINAFILGICLNSIIAANRARIDLQLRRNRAESHVTQSQVQI